MAARKPLIAGNWKMYGRAASLAEIAALERAIGPAGARLDVLICPPVPYLHGAMAQARGTNIQVGAQDCSAVADDSARTGEVSAAMLADAGARYVIVGHSERRSQHGESDALVRKKAEAATAAGLIPIVCVGETHAERASGDVAGVISSQVRNSMPVEGAGFVIAYEPVWCIGGDRTPTMEEIGEVHAAIRQTLTDRIGDAAHGVRILYGGAVNPKNAAQIFGADGVDGALVGRASLKAADFSAIILSHPAAT
ncbi:MAG TPA: triose-phosphate isomerase [Candidatus Binatia bacterium]|nr:triose-phosphate isomerase [Candidatus Binatia bacterium]